MTALDATSTTSCKRVIQAFRDNEEIFVGLPRHPEGVYGESIPMPRIVNRQANRANPLSVLPLQFSGVLSFCLLLTECSSNSAKYFALIFVIS